MSCSYQLIVVIGYELVSYLLFYFRKSEFIRRNIIINKLTTMFLLLHKHRKDTAFVYRSVC